MLHIKYVIIVNLIIILTFQIFFIDIKIEIANEKIIVLQI